MPTKKETSVKVDFTNSIEKIQDTAKIFNQEVTSTVTEVIEDLRSNGEKIRKAATENVKEMAEKISIDKGIKYARKAAQNINDYALETAEEVVDATLDGSRQWQKLAEKVIKNGFEIAEKQQEIIFDTLETAKGQLTANVNRVNKLFN